MRRIVLSLSMALTIATLAGCFSVQHQLPSNAYFGKLPKGTSGPGQPFATGAFKNWALAGLVPYSKWSTSGLLAEPGIGDAAAIHLREVETVFSPFDVLISIVPGSFYGYYVWAPRTIRVSGTTEKTASSSK